MSASRETILNALFEIVRNSSDFASASRRLRLWNAVSSEEKPAIFVVHRGDNYLRSSEGLPQSIVMMIDVYIYTDAGKNPETIPSSFLNPLIDGVNQALSPNVLTGVQTLGGLVLHCWIEGKSQIDAGDLDGNGVAVIPVRILLASQS